MTNPESFKDVSEAVNESEEQATFEQMTPEELEQAATAAAFDFVKSKDRLDAITKELRKREANGSS